MQAFESHILLKKKRGSALCLPSKRGARNNLRLDHPVCLLARLFAFSFADFLPCSVETRKLSTRIDRNRTLTAHMEAMNLLAASQLLDPPLVLFLYFSNYSAVQIEYQNFCWRYNCTYL